MIDENKIRQTISSNLVYYRKRCNLKQISVAEKIGYSDKAISKWERGESLPDIYVLYSLAELYEIEIEDLLSVKRRKVQATSTGKRNRLLVVLLSVGLTWLVATVAFVLLLWFGKGKEWFDIWFYMPYIYAIPVSFIICLVFNKIWGRRIFSFFLVSGIVWGIGLSLERSLCHYIDWAWLFYIICIPFQVLTCLWYLLKRKGNSRYTASIKELKEKE